MEQSIAKVHVGRLSGWLAMFVMVAACAEGPRSASQVESVEVMEEDEETSQRDTRAQGAEASPEQDQVRIDAEPEDDRAPGNEVAAASAARDESGNGHIPVGGDLDPDAPLEGSSEPAGDNSSAPSKVEPEPHAQRSVDAEPSAPSATEPTAPSAHSKPNTSAVDSKPRAAPAVDSEPSAPSGVSSQPADAGTAHTLCGSTSIRSRADLEDARRCTEIHGDLTVHSVGLTAIGADDLPRLTRITGNLVISGAQVTEPPLLESVTLPNLREVQGAVMVLGVAVVEFGSSGPLKELHLPALQHIGAHGTLGLGVYLASLTVLDLPALSAIDGSVVLDTLVDLCMADVSNVQHVGGDMIVRYVPRLLPAQLEPLRLAAAGPVREQELGCCALSSEERVSCEAFTENARALYCTGC